MNIIEQKLAQKLLFPKKQWLETLFKQGLNQEAQIFNKLMQEDFLEVIDTTKLQKLNLQYEVKMSFLDKPLAVQITQAINIGVPKHEQDGEVVEEQEDEEEVKKFENKYLDPSSMKEKKKKNMDSHRIMKLSLTDGLNKMDAIEHERLREIDSFGIGQKLMLKPPIEVRRGILLLNNNNVSYLGTAPPKATAGGTATQTGASVGVNVPKKTGKQDPVQQQPQSFNSESYGFNQNDNTADQQVQQQKPQVSYQKPQYQYKPPQQQQQQQTPQYNQFQQTPQLSQQQKAQINQFKQKQDQKNFSTSVGFNVDNLQQYSYQRKENTNYQNQPVQQKNQNFSTNNKFANQNQQQFSYYTYNNQQQQPSKYEEFKQVPQSKQESIQEELDLSDLEMALVESSDEPVDYEKYLDQKQMIQPRTGPSNYKPQVAVAHANQNSSNVGNSKLLRAYEIEEYSDLCLIEID